jgi:hypothetical protein
VVVPCSVCKEPPLCFSRALLEVALAGDDGADFGVSSVSVDFEDVALAGGIESSFDIGVGVAV